MNLIESITVLFTCGNCSIIFTIMATMNITKTSHHFFYFCFSSSFVICVDSSINASIIATSHIGIIVLCSNNILLIGANPIRARKMFLIALRCLQTYLQVEYHLLLMVLLIKMIVHLIHYQMFEIFDFLIVLISI